MRTHVTTMKNFHDRRSADAPNSGWDAARCFRASGVGRTEEEDDEDDSIFGSGVRMSSVCPLCSPSPSEGNQYDQRPNEPNWKPFGRGLKKILLVYICIEEIYLFIQITNITGGIVFKKNNNQ